MILTNQRVKVALHFHYYFEIANEFYFQPYNIYLNIYEQLFS